MYPDPPEFERVELEQARVVVILAQSVQHPPLFTSGLPAETDGFLRLLLLLRPELGDVKSVHTGPVEVVLGPSLLSWIHLVVTLRPC